MECIKVCPQASELSVIRNNLKCPEEGCEKIFQGSSALHMHLTKHHRHTGLERKDTSIPTHYYCPEESCIYHVSATRFFTQMKYLKQHYLKVHCERNFACKNCDKAFPTEDSLNHHRQICGIIFSCSCGNTYGSYEALLTHSKRKRHIYDDKFKQYGKRVKSVCQTVVDKKVKNCRNPEHGPSIYILPKLPSDTVGVPVNILAAVALTELSGSCSKGIDKEVQTDNVEARRKKASSPAKASERAIKRRASAQTQTGVISKTRRPRKSAKTQTIDAGTLKNVSPSPKVMFEEGYSEVSKETVTSLKEKKSMETQTSLCNLEPTTLSVDSTFEMRSFNIVNQNSKLITDSSSLSPSPIYPSAKDVGLPDLWFAHKNTSSTQTSPVATNQSSIPSDLNLTFFECDSNVSSSNLNYFEDNSDSLDNVVNSTVSQLEPTTSTSARNLDALESITSESTYNSMYPLLSQQASRSCNIETQTELDLSHSFLNQCSEGSDEGQFTLCSNTETQTTEDIFDELLYSNMCTQTCDEGLFTDLDFVDIETQTAWPNYDESESKLNSDDNKTNTAGSSSQSDNNSLHCKETQAKSKPCSTVVKCPQPKNSDQTAKL